MIRVEGDLEGCVNAMIGRRELAEGPAFNRFGVD
jgi:hypothetical protein